MKRVDFDPNGARNPQNRGKSGYVRISWEEAIKLVTDEIKRQKREYGPGCIAVSHGSHHTWGNIGYYLSALFRFRQRDRRRACITIPIPEGWYWGAVHHWGYTLRIGRKPGTVETACRTATRSCVGSRPESTSGSYGAGGGTVCRRGSEPQARHQGRSSTLLLRDRVPARFAPKPTTSFAMAMAIFLCGR
jgi:trimethylamine-N-oxide reductase (cytochrome c)